MNRFNEYMANHFGSCKLLAHADDLHRNRKVKIYAIPGWWDVVGVTDGVEAWIAPVSPSLFSVNVTRLIEDMHAGRPLPKPEAAAETRRRRVVLIDQEPQPVRRQRVQLHA